MTRTKMFVAVMVLAPLLPACGQGPFCCALDTVSKDTTYTDDYRSTLKRIADGNDEDVCQVVVEDDESRFEDALAACSN